MSSEATKRRGDEARNGLCLAVPLLLALLAAPAAAQETPDDPPPPEAQKEDPPGEQPTKDAPPSLDELLGIEDDDGQADRSARDVAEEDARQELERRLNESEIGSAFEEALTKMGIAAEQLEQRFDTGLGTQRVQEEVLAKLEFLLDEAKKQQQSGASSSSSSTPSPSPGQPQDPGAQASGAPQPEQPSDDRQGESQPGDPPGMQQGDVNTILEEGRTEWGTLPQRVRDMLLQGRSEKFSSLYEQLTREYYRRLAEEGSP